MRLSLARRQSPQTFKDVITYRLGRRMMYVRKAQTFDQAVTFARSVFESDLKGVDQSRISFSLIVKEGVVGISPLVWPTIMVNVVPYRIIEVHVQPEVKVSHPPSYAVSQRGREGAAHSLH